MCAVHFASGCRTRNHTLGENCLSPNKGCQLPRDPQLEMGVSGAHCYSLLECRVALSCTGLLQASISAESS